MYAKGLVCAVIVIEGEDVILSLESLGDNLPLALILTRHHNYCAVALDGGCCGCEAVHGIYAGFAVGVCKDETCVVAVVEFECLVDVGGDTQCWHLLPEAYALGMRTEGCGAEKDYYGEQISHYAS